MTPGVAPDRIISGVVWYDRNRNGLRDADERGIAGVVLRVLVEGSAPLTAVTAGDGSYRIAGLVPGTYVLSARTVDVPTNGAKDRTVTLTAGTIDAQQDYGYAKAKVLGITSEREAEGVEAPLAFTGAQSLLLLASALILLGAGGLLVDRRQTRKR